MGSEQIFKKSVLGGFKKEGVLNYVEQLQTEIIELKKEITNKPDLSEEVKALKDINENAVAETTALTAKIDALKAENEALTEANLSLVRDLEEAKMLINEYEEKQKIFAEKISEIDNKFSRLTSDFVCSDSSASDIKTKANDAVENARNEIGDINERIKTTCNNFVSSSSALKTCVENLLDVLSSILDDFNS
ncbi:MAG: hypothetical protein IKJ41_05380 [Clostridia bacterium]|nr:hypothetical protein [Clostridia bacterium]